MPATEPTEPKSSDWNFSAAIDLLRSPTYVGGSAPAVVRLPESTGLSPLAEEQTSNDVDSISLSQAADLKSQRGYTQLGDFGSLWDLLGQTTDPTRTTTTGPSKPGFAETSVKQTSPVTVLQRYPSREPSSVGSPAKSISVSKASQPRVSQDHVAGRPARVSTQPEVVTILKRASNIKPTGTHTVANGLPPRTPPRAIGDSTSNDTTKAKSKPCAGGKRTQTKANDGMISSSAETDSDSSTIVFDRPLSKRSGVLAFVPSQVCTLDARNEHDDTPPSSFDDLDSTLKSDTGVTLTASGIIRIRPTAYKSATDRRVGLMTKLLKEFPDYANLVSQVGRVATFLKHSVKSRPIHVFVDMSNIMVGFHDSVKVSRNMSITTRIRRVHMSFTNFSMILERGRPTAKRVLVGSDRLPSIDEAEKLGYEKNILNRVHKVKHTAPRASQLRKDPGLAPTGAGPETAAASGERWVEQGVDEILHLKILESLLDTDEPATIVLATGDAAEAEYSGGFMRMVERALQRGWAVELVSFSQVTSSAYRKKEFRAKWGQRFRVVELDGYIEELFD